MRLRPGLDLGCGLCSLESGVIGSESINVVVVGATGSENAGKSDESGSKSEEGGSEEGGSKSGEEHLPGSGEDGGNENIGEEGGVSSNISMISASGGGICFLRT